VDDFTPTDRSSRQKIYKGTSQLNDTIEQMDLADIYRVVEPIATKCIFFSAAHRTFSKINHIFDIRQVFRNTGNGSNFLYLNRPQWKKSRNQQVEKLQKISKHMETEQFTLK
jgi:hypothetical protein